MLILAALAVGYLFDRGRTEALEQVELDRLRHHAERSTDETERFVKQLRSDVLFLAGVPPIQGIGRAIEAGGLDPIDNTPLKQWEKRLQQIFLSFAFSRPEYFQLRLIGLHDGGRELVRIERTDEGLIVSPPETLEPKGAYYYVREASGFEPGSVFLSRIDLNRERGRISVPHRPTLRAATPVLAPGGDPYGVVVINMDMGWVFERTAAFRDTNESAYVADERGDILLHPQPGHAFAFEFDTAFRLMDAFPGYEERIATVPSGASAILEISRPEGGLVTGVATCILDPRNSQRRLIFILTKSAEQLSHTAGLMRRESLLGMGGLLSLATVLVVIMVGRLTRSLRVLAKASGKIAMGDYRVALPEKGGVEVKSLALAFRHMVARVERREEALAELNRELEQRVGERTREITRQHDLHQLILESIADGIVVNDLEGRFLLWNRKAEQIVGSSFKDIPLQHCSTHFGLFGDESGEPLPVEELPLVQAIHEKSSVNAELYVRNPRRMPGRWVQVTARPLKDAEGGISGAVAVLVDVTEERRLRVSIQGHRAELAEMGRLALSAEITSSVAHQLSQPIAAMSNYAGATVRLHEQGRLEERDLSEILARIERLATKAGEILGNLRSRIHHRRQVPSPVDVNGVVASCVDLLKDRLERYGIRVDRRYEEGLPRLMGDPIGLEQVLVQLVSNAVESMEKTKQGERCLSIGTGYDRGAHLVFIEIGDTGPGVNPTIGERLFDPWETDKPGALGIGLSIAQTIVEAFGGRVDMMRAVAGGALFRVELPVPGEHNSDPKKGG